MTTGGPPAVSLIRIPVPARVEIIALWTYLLHNLLTEDERDAQGQSHAAE